MNFRDKEECFRHISFMVLTVNCLFVCFTFVCMVFFGIFFSVKMYVLFNKY